MKRYLAPVLALIMAAALCFGLTARLRTRQTELARLQTQTDGRVAAWQRIAEDKETLQETLTALENDVREAQLSLTESTERAEELTAQVEALTAENAALTADCAAAEALNDRLTGLNTALKDRTAGE